jgi:hypothetical protein
MVHVEADSGAELNAHRQTQIPCELAMASEAILVTQAARKDRRRPDDVGSPLREVWYENDLVLVELLGNSGDVLHGQVGKVSHADDDAGRPSELQLQKRGIHDPGQTLGAVRVAKRGCSQSFRVCADLDRIADDRDPVDRWRFPKDAHHVLE